MPATKGNVAALILAGGLSSRMGREKSSLLIESRPLIAWAYQTACRFTSHVYISVHDSKMIGRLSPLLPANTTFLTDIYDGPRSVLLALLSCLTEVRENRVAVFPVDSPFIDKNLVMKMISRSHEFDLTIPIWPDGKLEIIHAIYNRQAVLPIIQDLWNEGTLELWQIPKRTRRTLFVATEELAELDTSLLSLRDADTPDEFDSLVSARAAMLHQPTRAYRASRGRYVRPRRPT